ncbi:MAG: hypothetical protein ABW116_06415 [Candidatus Sedimenticola sp. 20ELBAFRAG]
MEFALPAIVALIALASIMLTQRPGEKAPSSKDSHPQAANPVC